MKKLNAKNGHLSCEFSQNWFGVKNQKNWKAILGSLQFSASPNYLEVGVYEGQSFIWVAKNLLPSNTQLTAVDNFTWNSDKIFLKNVKQSGIKNLVKVIREDSQSALIKLQAQTFDLIYIDGAHDMKSVFYDALAAWRLLKIGGVIVFDDYKFEQTYRPLDLRPDVVIDCFLTAFRNELRVLGKKNHQVFVQKKKNVSRTQNETVFGPYRFTWPTRQLFKNEVIIILTANEILTLEKLFRQIRIGETEIDLSTRYWSEPATKNPFLKL